MRSSDSGVIKNCDGYWNELIRVHCVQAQGYTYIYVRVYFLSLLISPSTSDPARSVGKAIADFDAQVERAARFGWLHQSSEGSVKT